MKITKDKQYRTRSGNEVRVILDNNPGQYTAIAIWKDNDSDLWLPQNYLSDGRISRDIECGEDLIEHKEPKDEG